MTKRRDKMIINKISLQCTTAHPESIHRQNLAVSLGVFCPATLHESDESNLEKLGASRCGVRHFVQRITGRSRVGPATRDRNQSSFTQEVIGGCCSGFVVCTEPRRLANDFVHTVASVRAETGVCLLSDTLSRMQF